MRTVSTITVLLSLLVGCGDSTLGDRTAGGDVAANRAYVESIEAWRAERLARLTAPQGYLNLVGLFWLEDGTSRFGASPDNDLVFPATAARIGAFEVRNGRVRMTVERGVDVRVNGELVEAVFLRDDLGDETDTATLGTLVWSVIDREGKLGVRLWDLENPAAASLPPLPYFAIDAKWRVEARLRPFDEPRVMNVDTVIEGLGWNPTSPGVLEFEIAGERYTLEAYDSGARLFLVFGDETSGRATYPAGRFLYAERPDAGGRTVLDFNRAYNPPCAFNDFSTCPVASPRNRLGLEVTAGEKYDRALLVSSRP